MTSERKQSSCACSSLSLTSNYAGLWPQFVPTNEVKCKGVGGGA